MNVSECALPPRCPPGAESLLRALTPFRGRWPLAKMARLTSGKRQPTAMTCDQNGTIYPIVLSLNELWAQRLFCH